MTQKVKNDFTAAITVNKTANETFRAILDLRGWWSEEIEGNPEILNETFNYHYKDVHLCRLKLIEIATNKKIVWLVVDNSFNFIKDQTEWVNTKLVFEIAEQDGKTEITFTHQGLTNEDECYNICHDAWTGYIKNSLKNFIEIGKGNPNPKEGDGYNAELVKKWKIEKQAQSHTF